MITIFGLSMVGILAGRVALKGLVAAGLGMMIGTIGEGDSAGELCGWRPTTCRISSTA